MLGDRWEGEDDSRSFIEWIQQCTHKAEDVLREWGIVDWIEAHRRQKWKFFVKSVCDQDTWSLIALQTPPPQTRRLGRPLARWRGEIPKFPSWGAPQIAGC